MAVLTFNPSGARSRRGRLTLAILLGAAVLLFAGASAPGEEAAPSREYQLKAVFLFNFAQFVEWPAQALPTPDAPLIVGVLGTDPFGSALDDALRGESIGGRPLRTRLFRRVQDIDLCHVLYISTSEAKRLPQIVAALRGRGILTVCDVEDAARAGVMIRFMTERNHIRLRINLDAARAENLVISSKLLRHADIVSTAKANP